MAYINHPHVCVDDSLFFRCVDSGLRASTRLHACLRGLSYAPHTRVSGYNTHSKYNEPSSRMSDTWHSSSSSHPETQIMHIFICQIRILKSVLLYTDTHYGVSLFCVVSYVLDTTAEPPGMCTDV